MIQRLLLAAGFILSVSFPVAADDWPQWRGPNRDGISNEKGWKADWAPEGLKKLWERKVGIGYSSMSVGQGRLYTMGNVDGKDVVSCFDAATGAPVWTHEYASSPDDPNGYKGTRSTPTIDGDNVYTLGRHGHLFCFDAKTGKVKWAKNLVTDLAGREPIHSGGKREGWGFSGSPLIEKGWVLVEPGGASGSSVVALDKSTGEVVWKNGNDIAGYASLIAFDLNGERCLAHFPADHFVVRRMKDGSEIWRVPWQTSYGVNAATPIIHDNKIFISSAYNFGCALLDAKTGKEIWRNKNMKNHVNSCVLVKGHLYGFDDSDLKCLDWNTGEVKWSHKGYGKGSLILADGKLLLFGGSGKLGLAEATPESFKELSSFQAIGGKDTWSHPVLSNGRIYVRNIDTLVAFDAR